LGRCKVAASLSGSEIHSRRNEAWASIVLGLLMPLLPKLRVIVDREPQSGAWNMAVDEVLLQSAIFGEIASLRIYRWHEPTASLGYFQRELDFRTQDRFVGLPAVRRLTGGGTLIHDHELTYSLALPGSQQLFGRPIELYGIVHSGFIATLLRYGVEIRTRGTSNRLEQEPFLCFLREDENDLLLNRHKILGSAQRRRRGAILQHGGLILHRSSMAPEILGIFDLCSSLLASDWPIFVRDLAAELVSRIAESSEFSDLSCDEKRLAQQLQDDSYSKLNLCQDSSNCDSE